MKKPKSLETKLRSAIRLIWSRSKERREIIKQATIKHSSAFSSFVCPICSLSWPIQMAEVDHIEPVGELKLERLTEWVDKMFHSPQQAICKICHKEKTAYQRRRKK